jgi:hypothetical protein
MWQVRGKTKRASLCQEKHKELLLKQRYETHQQFLFDCLAVKVKVHWIMATSMLAKKILIQFQTMGKKLSRQYTTQFNYGDMWMVTHIKLKRI